MSKRGLGKGLQALIPDIKPSHTESNQDLNGERTEIQVLNVKEIKPRSEQPRRVFSEEKLNELAESIKEHGVIQPIVVRKSSSGYEIIAGERRWRACQKAGVEVIPVIVKEVEQSTINELALIENIQRENLNPIEEAIALQKLVDQFKLTQDQLAKKLGKSRPYIANSLRLNNLPDALQQMVASGDITSGHVRPLLSIKNQEKQIELAKMIYEKGLSVRQTEQLVKALEIKRDDNQGESRNQKSNSKDPLINQVEDRLRSRFGTAVNIKTHGSQGKIVIQYYDDEDLNRILDLVLGTEEF